MNSPQVVKVRRIINKIWHIVAIAADIYYVSIGFCFCDYEILPRPFWKNSASDYIIMEILLYSLANRNPESSKPTCMSFPVCSLSGKILLYFPFILTKYSYSRILLRSIFFMSSCSVYTASFILDFISLETIWGRSLVLKGLKTQSPGCSTLAVYIFLSIAISLRF